MATSKSRPKPAAASGQIPRFTLPGSDRPSFGRESTGRQPSGAITVTVIVRPRTRIDPSSLSRVRLTRAQFAQKHGADPVAVKAVRAFARRFGLAVDPLLPGQRNLRLRGPVAAMQRAFGVSLSQQTHNGQSYRVREGSLQPPVDLEGFVDAVLGLDDRPQAQPHFRVAKTSPATSHTTAGHDSGIVSKAAGSSYTPVQVAALYSFPENASGAGQTIGLIELGGGYRTADLTAYFKSLGQKAPKVTAVSVDGGKNSPSTADGADGEVMLDIEVAAAVAPGASVAVYFAPNTDQGFIDAISTAVHDTQLKPSVISISWGAPESSWTQQSITALDQACQAAAVLGVTIIVACGDNGSTDGGTGNNVDFPASSPHVLACGGTKLVGSGSTISSEVVWNELSANEGATGGGVSNVFPLPSWQSNAGVPKPANPNGGRGLPDVSGDADPATGYVIRVDGQTLVIGGTSAVAPLWAGLVAVANTQNGKSAGFLNPSLYTPAARPGFRDITSGSNGAFSAGPGWDPCTGLGSPIAAALIPHLLPATSTTKPTKGKGKGGAGKKKPPAPPARNPPTPKPPTPKPPTRKPPTRKKSAKKQP